MNDGADVVTLGSEPSGPRADGADQSLNSDEARRTRVDELVAEARVQRRRDYDRLKSLAEEAFDLASRPDELGEQYRAGMAAALVQLANLSSVVGEPETALHEATRALALVDADQPSVLLGEIRLEMGLARHMSGSYLEALNDLHAGLKVAETLGDGALTADAMDRIGSVYHATGHIDAALDMQSRSLTIYRVLGDFRGEAVVLDNMTFTYLTLGRRDDALASAFAALHCAESDEADYRLASAYDTVAEVYLSLGDLEKAMWYATGSLAIAEHHAYEPDQGHHLLTLAHICLERGELDVALDSAQRALSIAEEHRRAVDEFRCHRLVADIQERRGDTAEALKHYKRFHALERARINAETEGRIASIHVEHQLDTARKNAEIHRLRNLALEREIEERRIAQAELEAKASLDPLTGLFNRRHVPLLSEDLRRQLELGNPCALILFDVDLFKEINDEFGHFAGDRILVAVARLVSTNARDEDTPCRYGGDEFLMLLTNTDADAAGRIAERIRVAVEESPIQYRDTTIPITVSMGVASVEPEAPATLLRLIERADRALYTAKRSGRNRVVVEHS